MSGEALKDLRSVDRLDLAISIDATEKLVSEQRQVTARGVALYIELLRDRHWKDLQIRAALEQKLKAVDGRCAVLEKVLFGAMEPLKEVSDDNLSLDWQRHARAVLFGEAVDPDPGTKPCLECSLRLATGVYGSLAVCDECSSRLNNDYDDATA